MKKILVLVIGLIILFSGSVMAKEMVIVENYEQINAKPGEKTENNITVRNPADETANIEVWIQDWKTAVNNKQIVKKPLSGAGVLDHSLAPYLTLKSPTNITIPPNGTVDIAFTTEVPKSKEGTFWTAIVVAQYANEEKPKESQKSGKDQVNIRARFAWFSKVIRSDDSNENLKPWISFLSKPNFDEETPTFSATLENRGDIAFFYPSRLTIYEGLDKDNNPIVKKDGKEAIASVAPFYLFPDESLELETLLPFDLPPGKYTAKFKILMERGEYAPVAWREFKVKE